MIIVDQPDAHAGEGHVLLLAGHANGSLSAVAEGKLVPDLRHVDVAHAHLGEAVDLFSGAHKYLVHNIVGLHGHATVFLVEVQGSFVAGAAHTGNENLPYFQNMVI